MYFFLKKNQSISKISDLNQENQMLKVRLEELDILKDEKKELDIKYQSLEEKLTDSEKINVGLKKDLEQSRETKDETVDKFAAHTNRLNDLEEKRQQKLLDDKENFSGSNMRMMFKITFKLYAKKI